MNRTGKESNFKVKQYRKKNYDCHSVINSGQCAATCIVFVLSPLQYSWIDVY